MKLEGMKNIVAVIDIETLGTCVDAKIGSIGAVVGNLMTREVYSSFYVRTDVHSVEQENRSKTDATVKFWERQEAESPEAYDEMFNPNLVRHSLSRALNMLNAFIQDGSDTHKETCPRGLHVFANGPEFDCSIVKQAMSTYNIQPSWGYGNNQSIRTLVLMERILLGTDAKSESKPKIRHHALSDAEHEFEYGSQIVRRFR